MLDQVWVTGFPSAFFRALGMLAVLPLGSWSEGAARRGILALGLALLFADAAGAAGVPEGLWSLTVEFMLGAILGLPWALAVEAAGMLGELIDAGRGQSIAHAYDPLSDVHHPQMAVGLRLLVWVTLLWAGAGEWLLLGLKDSFDTLPPGALSASKAADLGANLLSMLSVVFAGLLSTFLPFALLYIVVDCALAFAAKLLPMGSLFGEAFQLKTYLGLVLLLGLVQMNWPDLMIGFCRAWSGMLFV